MNLNKIINFKQLKNKILSGLINLREYLCVYINLLKLNCNKFSLCYIKY